MIFELTDLICSQILFAMENQQKAFALDAEKLQVTECDPELVDEERFYSLPVWSSSDGYNLLESFTEKHKGVNAYCELRNVLAEGRGVFKNFKNTLKHYPELDKRFHSFKNGEMRNRVYEWYNALRESWGLEALDQEFYEYDDLTLEDFNFRAFDYSLDSNNVASEADAFLQELKNQYDDQLGDIISSQMEVQTQLIKKSLEKKELSGFVCRTLTDEFAGCILYSYLSGSQKNAAVTALFVNNNFRGLGIATQLLEQGLSILAKDGTKHFIFSNSIVPQLLKPALARMGFKEMDFAFVGELN